MLSLFNPTPFNPWLYMPSTILFPLSIAYAMLRYNQFNFDRLLTAGASYVIAGALVVVIYFVSAYLVSLVAGSSQTLFANPGLAVLFVLLAVMLLDAPRQRLERTIERIFFQEPLRHAGPAAELQPPPDRSVGPLVGGASAARTSARAISSPRCCTCICWTCA